MPLGMKLMRAIIAICAVTAAPAAAATSRNCTDELKAAIMATFNSGPYEVRATMKTAIGDHLTVSEVVPGVGFHSIVTIGEIRTETLVLNDGTYLREAGTWTRLSSADDETNSYSSPPALADLEAMQRPRCLGYRMVNGRRLAAFGFGADTPEVTTDTIVYVNPATGHTVRAVTTMVIGGEASDAIADYRYDLSITLPTP